MRLCILQNQLGGFWYIEQPRSSSHWRNTDSLTYEVLHTSNYALRDLCADGLVHPQSQLPLHRTLRVQSNSKVFEAEFNKRCSHHQGVPHAKLLREEKWINHAYPSATTERITQVLCKNDSITLLLRLQLLSTTANLFK